MTITFTPFQKKNDAVNWIDAVRSNSDDPTVVWLTANCEDEIAAIGATIDSFRSAHGFSQEVKAGIAASNQILSAMQDKYMAAGQVAIAPKAPDTPRTAKKAGTTAEQAKAKYGDHAGVHGAGKCLCGCGGEPTRSGSATRLFVIGHDSALKNKLRYVAEGKLGAEALPPLSRWFLARWHMSNPDHLKAAGIEKAPTFNPRVKSVGDLMKRLRSDVAVDASLQPLLVEMEESYLKLVPPKAPAIPVQPTAAPAI